MSKLHLPCNNCFPSDTTFAWISPYTDGKKSRSLLWKPVKAPAQESWITDEACSFSSGCLLFPYCHSLINLRLIKTLSACRCFTSNSSTYIHTWDKRPVADFHAEFCVAEGIVLSNQVLFLAHNYSSTVHYKSNQKQRCILNPDAAHGNSMSSSIGSAANIRVSWSSSPLWPRLSARFAGLWFTSRDAV